MYNVIDITLAKDGVEAVDMFEEALEGNKKFDIIFMDIQVSISLLLFPPD